MAGNLLNLKENRTSEIWRFVRIDHFRKDNRIDFSNWRHILKMKMLVSIDFKNQIKEIETAKILVQVVTEGDNLWAIILIIAIWRD